MSHPVEASTPVVAGRESHGRARRRPIGNIRLIGVLGLLSGFGAMSVDLYLPAMPDLADTFAASATMVQISLTASVIGLGLGQLLIGPLIDVLGRRVPLVVGIGVFTLFSVGCALANSLPLLIAFRFCQALGGAAGQVTARAIARDVRSGHALANLYATLMIVTGVMPLIAPVLGAQLMVVGASWRTIFLVQGVFGVALAILTVASLRGLTPTGQRRAVGMCGSLRRYGVLLRDRRFMTHVLAGAFCVAAIFSFVAGSTFVMQDVYGLSAQAFSLCFAASGLGLVLSSQTSRVWPVRRRLVGGAVVMLVGGVLQAVGVFAHLGAMAIVIGGFVTYCGFGAASPAALALAMADQAAHAGVAAAVYGAAQFGFAGVVGPLVGLAGRYSAVPMVLLIVLWSTLALVFALSDWSSRRLLQNGD